MSIVNRMVMGGMASIAAWMFIIQPASAQGATAPTLELSEPSLQFLDAPQDVAINFAQGRDGVTVSVPAGMELVVFGTTDEPVARVSEDGTGEVNINSPSYYSLDQTWGGYGAPDFVDASAPPRWISTGDSSGNVTWRDRRVVTASTNGEFSTYWSLPASINGNALVLTGTTANASQVQTVSSNTPEQLGQSELFALVVVGGVTVGLLWRMSQRRREPVRRNKTRATLALAMVIGALALSACHEDGWDTSFTDPFTNSVYTLTYVDSYKYADYLRYGYATGGCPGGMIQDLSVGGAYGIPSGFTGALVHEAHENFWGPGPNHTVNRGYIGHGYYNGQRWRAHVELYVIWLTHACTWPAPTTTSPPPGTTLPPPTTAPPPPPADPPSVTPPGSLSNPNCSAPGSGRSIYARTPSLFTQARERVPALTVGPAGTSVVLSSNITATITNPPDWGVATIDSAGSFTHTPDLWVRQSTIGGTTSDGPVYETDERFAEMGIGQDDFTTVSWAGTVTMQNTIGGSISTFNVGPFLQDIPVAVCPYAPNVPAQPDAFVYGDPILVQLTVTDPIWTPPYPQPPTPTAWIHRLTTEIVSPQRPRIGLYEAAYVPSGQPNAGTPIDPGLGRTYATSPLYNRTFRWLPSRSASAMGSGTATLSFNATNGDLLTTPGTVRVITSLSTESPT